MIRTNRSEYRYRTVPFLPLQLGTPGASPADMIFLETGVILCQAVITVFQVQLLSA